MLKLFLVIGLFFNAATPVYCGGNEPQNTSEIFSRTDIENIAKEMVQKALQEPMIYKLWAWKGCILLTIATVYGARKIMQGNSELNKAREGDIDQMQKFAKEMNKEIDILKNRVTGQASIISQLDHNTTQLILNINSLGNINEDIEKVETQQVLFGQEVREKFNLFKTNINNTVHQNNNVMTQKFETLHNEISTTQKEQLKNFAKVTHTFENYAEEIKKKCESVTSQVSFSANVRLLALQNLESELVSIKNQLNIAGLPTDSEMTNAIATIEQEIANHKKELNIFKEKKLLIPLAPKHKKRSSVDLVIKQKMNLFKLEQPKNDETFSGASSMISNNSFILNSSNLSTIGSFNEMGANYEPRIDVD